jgi:hypothetical protein
MVLLALGTAAHFEHHLLGSDCDNGSTPRSHPCASCSVLHGGTLAETGIAAIPPAPSHPTEAPPPEIIAPIAMVRGLCAPRAPPLG